MPDFMSMLARTKYLRQVVRRGDQDAPLLLLVRGVARCEGSEPGIAPCDLGPGHIINAESLVGAPALHSWVSSSADDVVVLAISRCDRETK